MLRQPGQGEVGGVCHDQTLAQNFEELKESTELATNLARYHDALDFRKTHEVDLEDAKQRMSSKLPTLPIQHLAGI